MCTNFEINRCKIEDFRKMPKSYVFVDVCGTLKCENAAICEKVAKCEQNSTLNVKIDAICEKNNPKCEKIRLSKCVKYFDSKCVKIDAICANFILTLFVKI